ncbi:MAG: hypothetical protein HRT88_21200, partial [Lentisphaeraceae bacterium]|nr:hypothetical protein [Lentisphaeraceae bacterium]
DQELSDQKILVFIKKVLLTFNDDQALHAHIDIPWDESGFIDFEIMPKNLNSQ